MSLGARRQQVISLILRQGMGMGIIGLLGAWALSGTLHGLLFEVDPTDPATFVAAPLIMVSVAFCACWIPACRAARVDPMAALRHD